MKKINTISLLLITSATFLLSVFSTSCVEDYLVGNDFLEKPPGNDVTIDTIFNDPNHARGFLWNAYGYLYFGLPWDWGARANRMGMGMTDALTDIYHSGLSWDAVNGLYYNGLFSATSDPNASKYSYTNGEEQWTGIRYAYIFLENIDKTPRMEEEEKERLKAEAKMIIACLYTDMFRHFGGVPILKASYQKGDEPIGRATVQEMLDFITGLCDEAYEVLPWVIPEEDAAQWDGRMTAAAALGLKIRVQLHAASPLFNDDQPFYPEGNWESVSKLHVWLGQKEDKMWTDVIGSCEKFMRRNQEEGNPVKLVTNASNPRQAYQDAYYVRNNGELLITPRIRPTVSWFWDKACYWLQSIGAYGALTPTLEYVNMFPYADGTPFDPAY